VTFATFPANCWFGEGSILKQEPRKYDVVALRDCRVALMPAVTSFPAAGHEHLGPSGDAIFLNASTFTSGFGGFV